MNRVNRLPIWVFFWVAMFSFSFGESYIEFHSDKDVSAVERLIKKVLKDDGFTLLYTHEDEIEAGRDVQFIFFAPSTGLPSLFKTSKTLPEYPLKFILFESSPRTKTDKTTLLYYDFQQLRRLKSKKEPNDLIDRLSQMTLEIIRKTKSNK